MLLIRPEITTKSHFLDILKPGDAVMADKGFNVQDELATVGATLVIPVFLKRSNFLHMNVTKTNP